MRENISYRLQTVKNILDFVKKNTMVISIFFLSLYTNQTYAITCTTNNSSSLNYHTGVLSGISPPSFNPNNYAVGDIIYSGNGNITINNFQYPNPQFKCDAAWTWYNQSSLGIPVNKIYPTSIKGIGLRAKESTYWPYQSGGTYAANTWISYASSYPITIELIKTGEITASGTISGVFGGATANTETGPWLIRASWASPIQVIASVPTCSVNTTSITVSLLNPSAYSFKAVGSTTGLRPFQIGLTCSGGSLNTSTNVYITFTDTNQPGNTSTTLSLASGSGAATGLGLQILNNGIPIGYGPDSSAAGNTNQWKVANIAQGVSKYNIPLSVQYIQTAPTVNPGTVTGRATFTMSYQ